ncbi:PEP-CTERM sorting domain-containing protein [Pontiella sulfatireligans]|uniref:Peptidase S1 domain-containing protein n=1 Tax=Pontiella sulfatireligans TaxID=2750658 RepID=A0A6C2UPL1_9BACT|nr:PEP-CTERM sorting domain-containing protein [Pontiella sulfatireligans]VGO21999.1 hypothetical protein SCARR_04079 [Pontiella sulfatireligans]
MIGAEAKAVLSILLLSCSLRSLGILAGGEFSLPADRPSYRVDDQGRYEFVGALEISSDGALYIGSATALSRNWVLTAGHNIDLDDNGLVDQGLDIQFHLPRFGSYMASSFSIHPDFSGFGNPSIENDLSLIYFDDPLPELVFPSLGGGVSLGDVGTLVGFGRSGYGSYGYTTEASLTDRRFGFNVIDELDNLFRYDFDSPSSGSGLGNDLETIIGPGDSGGALLVSDSLVGVNTFTEGYGGRFGDYGGGVPLNGQWDWIQGVTGLTVPEPSSILLLMIGFAGVISYRRTLRRN